MLTLRLCGRFCFILHLLLVVLRALAFWCTWFPPSTIFLLFTMEAPLQAQGRDNPSLCNPDCEPEKMANSTNCLQRHCPCHADQRTHAYLKTAKDESPDSLLLHPTPALWPHENVSVRFVLARNPRAPGSLFLQKTPRTLPLDVSFLFCSFSFSFSFLFFSFLLRKLRVSFGQLPF